MSKRASSVSVIVTTYRSPEPLRLVLKALRRQTRPAEQVIVAEDGAWEVNRELVDGFRAGWPGELIHTTQADAGCRAQASRNRALRVADGEYIIHIDGDMLTQPEFVADHLAFARPEHFVQSRRVRFKPGITERLLAQDRIDIPWWSLGVKRRHFAIRAPLLARLMSSRDRGTRHTRGSNMAFWRQDLIDINGFDMAYEGWGLDDIDTVARLLHNGLRRIYLRQAAIAFHLYHPGQTKALEAANQQRFDACLAERRVRCQHGLEQISDQP